MEPFASEGTMHRKSHIILLVISGVLVACILAVLILFVIFANLIATPAGTHVTAHQQTSQHVLYRQYACDGLSSARVKTQFREKTIHIT